MDGLCKCGCGEASPRFRSGPRAGEPWDFKRGHALRGVGGYVPGTKGLTYHRPTKRWKIICRDQSRTGFYRAVMENELGRELVGTEQVHHINGDSTDDRPENLALYASSAEHVKAEHLDLLMKAKEASVAARRISDEELLRILAEWIAERGRLPEQREFDKDPDLPWSTTYFRRFGTWRRALEVAVQG